MTNRRSGKWTIAIIIVLAAVMVFGTFFGASISANNNGQAVSLEKTLSTDNSSADFGVQKNDQLKNLGNARHDVERVDTLNELANLGGKSNSQTASIQPLSMTTVNTYTISGSLSTTVTVMKTGNTTAIYTGTDFAEMVRKIEEDRAGVASELNFVDFDVENNSLKLTNGDYKISGNLSSKVESNANSLIVMSGTASLEVTGVITHKGNKGTTILNEKDGNITINGGTVSATTGMAISNVGGGSVIILSGKVTSANQTINEGTINLEGGILGKTAISIQGGTVENTGGTDEKPTCNAILNYGNGNIEIIDGIVSATTGNAISNRRKGDVAIKGGKISATTGRAIFNDDSGKITVSGGIVTSANNKLEEGTIQNLYSEEGYTAIEIHGGTIENTVANSIVNNGNGHILISEKLSSVPTKITAISGNAISNLGIGNVEIEGGIVSSTTGSAVINAGVGKIEIRGGTLSTTTGIAIYNSSTGEITISESTAVKTKITSQNILAGSEIDGTIYLASGTAGATILDISGGIVENSSTGIAINNKGSGNILVSSGKILSTTGRTIINKMSGNITVSGGEIRSTIATTIYNNSNGNITVSGGKVSSTKENTIYNYSDGKITVSGGTISSFDTVSTINTVIKNATDRGVLSVSNNPSITGKFSTYKAIDIAGYNGPGFSIEWLGSQAENTPVLINGNAPNKFSLTNLPFKNLIVKGNDIVLSQNKYIIKGTASSATVSKPGFVDFSHQGTLDALMTKIEDDRNGVATELSFDKFDIEGKTLNLKVGQYTLTGKISSSVQTPSHVIVSVPAGADVTVIVDAEMMHTGAGSVIQNKGIGSIKIVGGVISSTTGIAIQNNSSGNIIINDGKISTTTGNVINNLLLGGVTVTGGTISTKTGTPINSDDSGNITISGGTISSQTRNAINYQGYGKVLISGGEILAPKGYAINSLNECLISITNNAIISGKIATKKFIDITGYNGSGFPIEWSGAEAEGDIILKNGTGVWKYDFINSTALELVQKEANIMLGKGNKYTISGTIDALTLMKEGVTDALYTGNFDGLMTSLEADRNGTASELNFENFDFGTKSLSLDKGDYTIKGNLSTSSTTNTNGLVINSANARIKIDAEINSGLEGLGTAINNSFAGGLSITNSSAITGKIITKVAIDIKGYTGLGFLIEWLGSDAENEVVLRNGTDASIFTLTNTELADRYLVVNGNNIALNQRITEITVGLKDKTIEFGDPYNVEYEIILGEVDGDFDFESLGLINNYNSETMRNAGEYKIALTGGGKNPKYIVTLSTPGTLTIRKKAIDRPSVIPSELVYNGNLHEGVTAVGIGFRYSGTTSAINAGEYEAIATLESGNYKWKTDPATEGQPISLKWSIAKANQTPLTLTQDKIVGNDSFKTLVPYIKGGNTTSPLVFTMEATTTTITISADGIVTLGTADPKFGEVRFTVAKTGDNNYKDLSATTLTVSITDPDAHVINDFVDAKISYGQQYVFVATSSKNLEVTYKITNLNGVDIDESTLVGYDSVSSTFTGGAINVLDRGTGVDEITVTIKANAPASAPDGEIIYSAAEATMTLTITKKELTLTEGILATPREYNGKRTVVLQGETSISGIINGDVIEHDFRPGDSAEMADANVGTAKIVNADIKLSGAKYAFNYVLKNQPTITAEITPRLLTADKVSAITITENVKFKNSSTYFAHEGGKLDPTVILAGDEVKLVIMCNTETPAVGDDLEVKVTHFLTGAAGKNYSLEALTTDSRVSIKPPTADALPEIDAIKNSISAAQVKAIEDVKVAYEMMTQEERQVFGAENKKKLDDLYNGLIGLGKIDILGGTKREFSDTMKVGEMNVFLYGILSRSKVDEMGMSSSILKPYAKESLIGVPEPPYGYTLGGGYEIHVQEMQAGDSNVTRSIQILNEIVVKIEIEPSQYIKVYHKHSDGRTENVFEEIDAARLNRTTEGNKSFVSFAVSDFSEFYVYRPVTSTGGGGGSGGGGSSGGGGGGGGGGNSSSSALVENIINQLKTNSYVELALDLSNKSSTSVTNRLFDALRDSTTNLRIKTASGEWVMTPEDMKGLSFDTREYSIEEVLQMIENKVVVPPVTPEPEPEPESAKVRVDIIVIVSGGALLILAAGVLVFTKLKKKKRLSMSNELDDEPKDELQTMQEDIDDSFDDQM